MTAPKNIQAVHSLDDVGRRIFWIRGHRVMLDIDLAELYGVPTKRLNEQIKRNFDRFPSDFMFRLSREEVEDLNRSQIATGSQKHRDPRFPPFAFTEHGAIMAANVLKTRIAVQASIQVVRAFVRMREAMVTHRELAEKLKDLERRYDSRFHAVFAAIKRLMNKKPDPPEAPQGRIGFHRS